MELIFDEKAHSYTVGGERLPSVTGILQKTGFIDSDWFTLYAATRGTFVHKACHYIEEGTLAWGTLDPALVGYVEAYQKFLSDTGWQSVDMEKPRWHKVLRYAGTPDRVGVLQGRAAILDLKTGIPSDWHRFQLSAYAMLVDPVMHNNFVRISLYLKSDGTYKMNQFSDKNDAKIFAAALTVYRAQGGL